MPIRDLRRNRSRAGRYPADVGPVTGLVGAAGGLGGTNSLEVAV